jgi:DNA invertase Pin-like site-specific DNA recombinase
LSTAEPKKRVALYARVSTDMQATGLEAQVRTLKEYCVHNKIAEFELFSDENISGMKSSRPSLDRMMTAVKAGDISCVIVYSFSRFARSTTHLLNALEEFKKRNVAFVSLTEKIDTTSALGLAIFTILGAVAQLERDLISERVRNGLKNARAKGKHIGRAKLRDSDLIRKLRKAGLTYRAISTIAKCSHGSVHAEILAQKREQREAFEKAKAQEAERQAQIDSFAIPALQAGQSNATQVDQGPKSLENMKDVTPSF